MAETRTNFVRISLGGIRRKLSYEHKDLRDASAASGRSFMDLAGDPFNGWPYLLLYGLRWQGDRTVTLDRCSAFIDQWVKEHKDDEKPPMESLSDLLMEALVASGFVRLPKPEPLEEDKSTDQTDAMEGQAQAIPED